MLPETKHTNKLLRVSQEFWWILDEALSAGYRCPSDRAVGLLLVITEAELNLSICIKQRTAQDQVITRVSCLIFIASHSKCINKQFCHRETPAIKLNKMFYNINKKKEYNVRHARLHITVYKYKWK